MSTWTIREIESKDNQEVKKLIQDVLVEMEAPKEGTAYEDKSLDDMTATYEDRGKAYFVVEENNKIIGGAGIAPLIGMELEVCELQKMYFLPEARGRGIGMAMIEQCLEFARKNGFEKCYIETLPSMENARRLYEKSGFIILPGPMGNTGHYNCSVFLLKDI